MWNFIIFGVIITSVYLIGLVLLITRWRSAYIFRRSPLMLCISLIGNLVQTLLYLSQIDEISKDLLSQVNSQCEIFFRIRQSLNLLFHYTLFAPYILRVYRLYIIFKVDQHWEDSQFSHTRYIRRTQQRWMFTVYCIFMIPILGLVVVILTNCKLSEYLPASESNFHKLYSESIYLSISFIEELLFIFCIYYLRQVSDDYEMTKELGIVAIVWFITPSLTLFPPVNLKNFKSFPGLVRNLVLFFVSTFLPIVASFVYKINEEFFTVEMLESFETVLQSKKCLEQFEKFLWEGRGKANDSKSDFEGYQLLMLYMKCENFIMFPDLHDKEELIQEILDMDVIPISYINNEKNGIEVHVEKAKESIKKILNSEFFDLFKNSRRYLELKRLVYRQEIYIGRLLEIGLTKTFSAI